MKWIKCSDRLPEKNQYVLVYQGPMCGLQIGFYGGWGDKLVPKWHNQELFELDATHWMPLPICPDENACK